MKTEPQFIAHVGADSRPFLEAMASLEHAFERFPEVVQLFLDSLDIRTELCRVDRSYGVAVAANEFGITLQPSDRLRDFLAATLAGDVNGVAIQI